MDWLFRVGLDDTQFTRGVSRVESVTSQKFNRIGRTIEARTEGYRKFVGAIGSTVGIATQALGVVGLVVGAVGGLVTVFDRLSGSSREAAEAMKAAGEQAQEALKAAGQSRAGSLASVGLVSQDEAAAVAQTVEASRRVEEIRTAIYRAYEANNGQASDLVRSLEAELAVAFEVQDIARRRLEIARERSGREIAAMERQSALEREIAAAIAEGDVAAAARLRTIAETAEAMQRLRDLEQDLRAAGRDDDADRVRAELEYRAEQTAKAADNAEREAVAAAQRAQIEARAQAAIDAASDAVTAARLGGGDVEAAQARLEYEREIARIQLDQTITEERRAALMAQQQGLLEQRIRLLELARREQAEDLAMQIRMDFLRATGREDEARAEQIREQAARRRRQIEQASGLTAAQRLALLAQVGATEAAQLAGLGGAGQAQGQSRTLAGGASLNATQLRQALGSGSAGQQSPQGRIVSNTQRTADGVGRMVALMAQSVQLLRGGLAGVYA